ncbi:MAG: type II toxin-antitoxin system prevent-host-death family antitoxin [Phycisphaerales bacterium]
MRELWEEGASIGADEAKTHLSELLDRVHEGEEITITKHGAPVARLVPVKARATSEERRVAIEWWLETSRGLSLSGLDIRDLIDEGRR